MLANACKLVPEEKTANAATPEGLMIAQVHHAAIVRLVYILPTTRKLANGTGTLYVPSARPCEVLGPWAAADPIRR